MKHQIRSVASFQETPYLYQIPVSTPTLYPNTTTNVYFLLIDKELLIVDAGYEDEVSSNLLLQLIEELRPEKTVGIVITHHHKDHAPGAKTLAESLKCPIYCHELEVAKVESQIAPLQVSIKLRDRDTLQIGNQTLEILHTPGHTEGHLSLWWQSQMILIVGDCLVSKGTTWIGPPDGNLIAYLQSLKRLQELHAEKIAPGHGEIIENPYKSIQFVLNRRNYREQQILQLLQEEPRTLEVLFERVYGDEVHPSIRGVAEKTILGHLEKLLVEGRAIQDQGTNLYRIQRA